MAHVFALYDSQEGRQGSPYWRLVRGVRVGRRVIQQTVAHLGELDEQGRIEARVLVRRLTGVPVSPGINIYFDIGGGTLDGVAFRFTLIWRALG